MPPSAPAKLRDVGAGVRTLRVAPGGYGGAVLGGLLYNRSLLVSELIGNWRAGYGRHRAAFEKATAGAATVVSE